jgi:hypothetical protein
MRSSLVALLLPLAVTARGSCRMSFRRPLCSLSCKLGLGGRCRGTMHHPPSAEALPTAWEMVRLHDDGKNSHWSTWRVPFTSGGAIGRMTDRLPCDGVWLRWTSGSYDYEWHNAPRRQLIATLNGHVEARVGSGERRRFGPGDVLLAEDTGGRGHCTKSLDGAGRWSVFIALPDDSPLAWLWQRPTTRELVLLALVALVAGCFILHYIYACLVVWWIAYCLSRAERRGGRR